MGNESLTLTCYWCGRHSPVAPLAVAIVDLLETDGGWVHGDILKDLAVKLGRSPQSINQYVARLKKAGIVESRRVEGAAGFHYYSIESKGASRAEYRLIV